jgi:hypothetical protein
MGLSNNRTTFTFNHTGQPDEYGISVGDYTEVQAAFDSRAEENLTDINNIKTTLRSVTDGDSGADNVGMTPIAETGNANKVQTIIEALITRLKATTDNASGADLIGATAVTNLDGSTVQALVESIRNKLKATTDGSSGADFVAMTPITETGAANTIQTVVEALISKLKTTTDGAAGADLIGATSISGLSGNTAQALLESLKAFIDAHKGTDSMAHPGGKITLDPDGKTRIIADDVQEAVDQIEEEFENIILGSANAEVGDAHISTAKSKTFPNIRARFEENESDLIAHMAENANKFDEVDTELEYKVPKAQLPVELKKVRGETKINTLKNTDIKLKIYGAINSTPANNQQHVSPTNIATLTSAGNVFEITQTDADGNTDTKTITAISAMYPYDYVTNNGEEMHYTRFRELLGTESWHEAEWASEINGSKLFYMAFDGDDNAEVFCTHFKWALSSNNAAFYNIFVLDGKLNIRAPYTTVNDFKAWLAAQKTANTPVQFYFRWHEPLNVQSIDPVPIESISDGDVKITVTNTQMVEATYNRDLQSKNSKLAESFSTLNIINAIAVNDVADKVAHVSNIEYAEDGWMYCAYLCDQTATSESASNLTTKIVLARFNIAKPYDVEYFDVCAVGDYINYFTLSGRAPYNPNVVVMSDGIVRIYVDVYNGTQWYIGYFQFDPDTDEFLTDPANGDRRMFLTCNISYNSNTYETYKAHIINLYSALGITATGSVGQFICKHVFHVDKWYTVFTGTGKALLISATNFKNYTLVSVFNSTGYMYADEMAIEFVDANTMVFLLRSNGGIYSGTYNLSTNTWSALTKISKAESRPQIIKNKNGIYAIYNREVPEDLVSSVNRKTVVVSKLNSDNQWEEIFVQTYPFSFHYPSYAKVDELIYLTFTSGKKGVYAGSVNNGVSTIQAMPIVLE